MAAPPLPARDLDDIQVRLEPFWPELAGARLLFTGCTGFFGPWLLEPLLAAQDRLGLGLRAWVLTRDPDAFRRRLPHLADHPNLAILAGDVRRFAGPGVRFTHVLHGAASSNARRDPQPPAAMADTILEGTRRVLAAGAGAAKALFISSGAVYGTQPPELERLAETRPPAPEPGYAAGKHQAEQLCVQAPFPVAIARCFAFLAPHLPLDAHYAAGNFLGARLRGEPPVILGDGRPVRSYLYGTDLAVWLYTILLRGAPGRPYNVGSEAPVSIRQLAAAVADGGPVQVAQPPGPGPAPRYLPATGRARSELGLAQTVDLAEAIRRTLDWYLQPAPAEVP
jgi:dTDP-glucose 4,6-dehydratase